MHVRAYNHWVSLLQGRAYPSIEDLDPRRYRRFRPAQRAARFHARDRGSDASPSSAGRCARNAGIDAAITHIAEVPSRSLLSRLTDHYLQIIANRAPIGFEAEFVGTRGHNTMYRGILMPFSSRRGHDRFHLRRHQLEGAGRRRDAGAADRRACRRAPRRRAAAARRRAVWADGPSAAFSPRAPSETHDAALPDGASLDRAAGRRARQRRRRSPPAKARSRAALYRALGQRARYSPLAAARRARDLCRSARRSPGSRRRRARR